MLDGIALFKIIWAPMGLLLGWLWHRTNSNQEDLRRHVSAANDSYATKKEVRELLALHLDPIRADIQEIKELLKEDRQWRNSQDRK